MNGIVASAEHEPVPDSCCHVRCHSNESSVFDHQRAVLQRAEAMAIIKVVRPCKAFHCFHDRGFGSRIDRTSGLVEDKDGSILQEGASQGMLALATGEAHAALTDLGLAALR